MRVYMNFTEVRGPYGGANSFLRTLKHELIRRGVEIVTDERARYDVALLNGLTNDIDASFAERIASRGTPIVHRKVGYRGRGSAELRAEDAAGVVVGDRLQVEFSPFLVHTIFQSVYSREVFAAGGFDGPSTVIHNGVDPSIFNQRVGFGPWRRPRPVWDGNEPLRVVISTWSNDRNKGFDDYARIDAALAGRNDVAVTLIGRAPADLDFEHIAVRGPYRRKALARELKGQHVVLQLARWETCSNALLEALNCGLPAIYLDSGANKELAEAYGVEYRDDFATALAAMRASYADLQARTRSNPFRIGAVADRYLEVLRSAA